VGELRLLCKCRRPNELCYCAAVNCRFQDYVSLPADQVDLAGDFDICGLAAFHCRPVGVERERGIVIVTAAISGFGNGGTVHRNGRRRTVVLNGTVAD